MHEMQPGMRRQEIHCPVPYFHDHEFEAHFRSKEAEWSVCSMPKTCDPSLQINSCRSIPRSARDRQRKRLAQLGRLWRLLLKF